MAKKRDSKNRSSEKKSTVGKAKASKPKSEDLDHIEEDVKDETETFQLRHPNREVYKIRRERSNVAVNRTGKFGQKIKEESKLEIQNTEENSLMFGEELPGILSKTLFAELSNYTSSFCITIFLPIIKTNAEGNDQMNMLAYKNALQRASSMLHEKQINEEDIERILHPAHMLIGNEDFWHKVSNGLGVFIADGFFKYVKMPITPVDDILVNKSFYISQLIPLLASKEHFYVLVISKKQAKLFRADAFGMQFVPIPEMPNGVEDVVHTEEKENQRKRRTEKDATETGTNYGIGGAKPDEKVNVAQYLEEVDDTIWKEVLHNENAPLLLAGVEYLIPIYKQVSDYNFIWYDSLTGSHEHDDINMLFQQALAIMQPYFLERQIKALSNYANHSATGLTSSIPEDVVPASHYAKVSHLFIQKNEHLWGRFDEKKNLLEIHENAEADDECMLDRSAIKTILNGGEVHILPKEKMPAHSKIAALMRY